MDRLTIVTAPVEDYLPTVEEPFDKVGMHAVRKCMPTGIILDLTETVCVHIKWNICMHQWLSAWNVCASYIIKGKHHKGKMQRAI